MRGESTQKLPIVLADRPGEPADQRDGDGDAGGGRDEVLHGQPGHLGRSSSSSSRRRRPASSCWRSDGVLKESLPRKTDARQHGDCVVYPVLPAFSSTPQRR